MNRLVIRSIGILVVVLGTSGTTPGGDADGAARQAPPPAPELMTKLRAPMVTVVQGQSFRAAAEAVAGRAGINLWIDRGVDPSAAIDLGHAGETVFDVLRRIASSRGCEVQPVRNVVLIGRPRWLDHTADHVFRLSSLPGNRGTDRNRASEIAWPELTTPEEALRIVTGNDAAAGRPLPHDLWPAVEWRGVDREVARTLVVTQCDPGPVAPSRRFEIRYRRPAGITSAAIQAWESEIRRADRQVTVTPRGRTIAFEGSVAAHRVATRLLIRAETTAAKSKVDAGDEPMSGDARRRDETATGADRFTLRLKNQPAGQILRELAATAGKECLIVSDARDASASLVSLEAKEKTLEQLAAQVAAEVGLRTEWGEQTLVVRPRD